MVYLPDMNFQQSKACVAALDKNVKLEDLTLFQNMNTVPQSISSLKFWFAMLLYDDKFSVCFLTANKTGCGACIHSLRNDWPVLLLHIKVEAEEL